MTECNENEKENEIALASMTPKFDWNDTAAVNNILRAHGMTREEMAKFAKDVHGRQAKPTSYYTNDRIDREYSIRPEIKEANKDVIDKMMDDMERNADDFFVRNSKKPSLFRTILNKINQLYYACKIKAIFVFTGKAPVLQCTEECFCEKHKKEYDVIFDNFRKSLSRDDD